MSPPWPHRWSSPSRAQRAGVHWEWRGAGYARGVGAPLPAMRTDDAVPQRTVGVSRAAGLRRKRRPRPGTRHGQPRETPAPSVKSASSSAVLYCRRSADRCATPYAQHRTRHVLLRARGGPGALRRRLPLCRRRCDRAVPPEPAGADRRLGRRWHDPEKWSSPNQSQERRRGVPLEEA